MSNTAQYKAIYRDIFNLHEKYANVVTEDDWGRFIADMCALTKKYDNQQFVSDMVQAVMCEVERVYRSNRAVKS